MVRNRIVVRFSILSHTHTLLDNIFHTPAFPIRFARNSMSVRRKIIQFTHCPKTANNLVFFRICMIYLEFLFLLRFKTHIGLAIDKATLLDVKPLVLLHGKKCFVWTLLPILMQKELFCPEKGVTKLLQSLVTYQIKTNIIILSYFY